MGMAVQSHRYEQPSHSLMYPKRIHLVLFINLTEDHQSGMIQIGNPFAFAPRVERMPNRRNTSEHVTKIERTMRTMIIHVRPATILVSSSLGFHSAKGLYLRYNLRDILLSAMESDKISARSRKTLQRSLSTWIRGLISRYSRTA